MRVLEKCVGSLFLCSVQDGGTRSGTNFMLMLIASGWDGMGCE